MNSQTEGLACRLEACTTMLSSVASGYGMGRPAYTASIDTPGRRLKPTATFNTLPTRPPAQELQLCLTFRKELV